MSTLARQVLGGSRKRKETHEVFKPPPKRMAAEPPKPAAKPSPLSRTQPPAPPALPAKNRLLAGYLAHEFLTRGTLFGEAFDPARAKPVKPAEPEQIKPNSSYADVAYLLKFDGTHIPGIVNPTQLGCWIQKRNQSS